MAIRFVDLFAGIGGLRLALERAGSECVYACDSDEDAVQTYQHNWDDDIEHADVRALDPGTIPDHDILAAGWPCPSFSIIGDRKGLEDERGDLFFEIVEVLEVREPDAFLLENVKNLAKMEDGEVYDIIREELKDAGYTVHCKTLNALDFGLPQHRERLAIVGFRNDLDDFTIPTSTSDSLDSEKEQREALDNLLVDDPSDEYLASKQIREDRHNSVGNVEDVPKPSIWHENRSQNIATNPYSCALRANASWNYILVNGRRHPTPRELLRLQGFPDWFEIPGNSYSRARKLTGRTIPVPAYEPVAEEIVEELV